MSPGEANTRQGGSHCAIAPGTAARAMSPASAEAASSRRGAAFIRIAMVRRSRASRGSICANKCGAVTARRQGRRPGAGARADEAVNFVRRGFERRHQPHQRFARSGRASPARAIVSSTRGTRPGRAPLLDHRVWRDDKDLVGLGRPCDSHPRRRRKAAGEPARGTVCPFRQPQPKPIGEIRLHLRAEESPLGQGLASALALKSEILRPRGIEKHDRLAGQRAIFRRP